MKKALVLGLSCIVVFSAAIPTMAAETQPQTCGIGNCNIGECFTDSDCDGICGDHDFIDENGDGICDNHCYIDENADGICDHYIDDDADGICDHCHEHGRSAQTTTYYAPQTTQRSGCHSSRHRSGHHGCHC